MVAVLPRRFQSRFGGRLRLIEIAERAERLRDGELRARGRFRIVGEFLVGELLRALHHLHDGGLAAEIGGIGRAEHVGEESG